MHRHPGGAERLDVPVEGARQACQLERSDMGDAGLVAAAALRI